MVPPFERFRLAKTAPATIELDAAAPDTTEQLPVARQAGVVAWAGQFRVDLLPSRCLAGR
jgi:hypothetical protein